ASETIDSGLLGQLPHGGGFEVLPGLHESAGQGPPSLEGLMAAFHEEDVEHALTEGEQDDVDGEGEVPAFDRTRVVPGFCHPGVEVPLVVISAPASASSRRAASTLSGVIPAQRSVTIRTAKPSRRASRAVARTQWSVAIPTSSTPSMARERSHRANESPSGVVPSKPEYAAVS